MGAAGWLQRTFQQFRSYASLFVTLLAQVPTDQPVVVHCHHGARSEYAIMILREVGYDAANLINLEGGIDAWSAEADPTTPRY